MRERERVRESDREKERETHLNDHPQVISLFPRTSISMSEAPCASNV